MKMMNTKEIIEEMKKRIKTHPYLKNVLKELMDDGLTEDDALRIMILAWQNQLGGDEKE